MLWNGSQPRETEPAMASQPSLVPVVRFLGEAKVSVHASIT
jgi:hypothetical protein